AVVEHDAFVRAVALLFRHGTGSANIGSRSSGTRWASPSCCSRPKICQAVPQRGVTGPALVVVEATGYAADRPARPQRAVAPFPWNRHRDRLCPDQRGRSRMRRRAFIAGLGSAAAWPVVARAQQAALPVIGYLSIEFADDEYKNLIVPFLQGLKETGYVDG